MIYLALTAVFASWPELPVQWPELPEQQVAVVWPKLPALEPPATETRPSQSLDFKDLVPAGGSVCPGGQCPLTYTPLPSAKAKPALESKPAVQYRRPVLRWRRR